jgi:MraZ protein
MFRGEFEHSLDEKGRILLPLKYRDELGETVILARGIDGQINLYPKPFFEDLERRVEESDGTGSFRHASRFLAAAIECEVDRQGRIVIPPTLRRHANLNAEVIIIGNRDYVEIWSPELWLQIYTRWVTQCQESPDDFVKMRELGLAR